MRLTKGQRAFFRAVAYREHGVFHKRVIEPIEGGLYGSPGGLVMWIGGDQRLAGCNAFGTFEFMLTPEGEALARELFIDPRAARDREFMQLRSASPLRPVAGRTADVDGLALFDHARQPAML